MKPWRYAISSRQATINPWKDIATGAYYRLPIPVQPMKAVASVLLTAQISPAALVASGVMMGLALLVLGLTGWITRVARLVPQSVVAGLQLGLGVALALVSLELMASGPVIGIVTLAVLLGLLLAPRSPSALIALAVALVRAGDVVSSVPPLARGGQARFFPVRPPTAFPDSHECRPAHRARR